MFTWRAVGFVINVIAVYIYSGSVRDAFVVGIGADVTKMGLYYAHERIWARIHFGRVKPPEYQI